MTAETTPHATARKDLIDCISPSTREKLGTVRVDSPDEIRAIVRRARKAQPELAKASHAQRRRVLTRVLGQMLDHADELCELVSSVSGKSREHAMMGEIWPVAEKLRWTSANAAKHLAKERVSSGMLAHKKATIEYVPRGVVGGIVPWNYPLQNLMNPIIPALASGNACVVKASEWVALASARVERIWHEALAAEDLPTELVRIVNGYAETGQALVESVDVVIFIGSVPNGKKVVEASAKSLTQVVLELGGKDPFVVCDDADLEQAVHGALAGTFINCGQNCVASERIILHQGIADAFEARVREIVSGFRQGPPLEGRQVDVGGMVTPLQRKLVEGLVARAVAQGARVVTGGKSVLSERGEFFAPTILADVTPEMEIMQEETFGPVMLLCRVRDDEHAISVANGTRFGLGASVFSKDHARAKRIADRIDAGMTAINDFGGLTYMAQDLPFGGVKESGFGRLNGRDGLRALTSAKAVLEDRFPLHFPNVVFPTRPSDYGNASGAIDLLYGPGLERKLRGLVRIVGELRANRGGR